MTKNEVINKIYKEGLVRKYGAKYLSKFNELEQEDLVSEVYLNICELDEKLLIDLYKQGWKHLTAYIKTFVEYQLSPTGKTRKLQSFYNTEKRLDEDKLHYFEDTDDIPKKKFYYDDYLDDKLNNIE